jgi:hypothetical protein
MVIGKNINTSKDKKSKEMCFLNSSESLIYTCEVNRSRVEWSRVEIDIVRW